MPVVINGTPGADVIDTNLIDPPSPDGFIVHGRNGDDQLDGSLNDVLLGENGNDTLRYGEFQFGGAGADNLLLDTPTGEAHGGSGDDTVVAEGGAAFGDSGNDTIILGLDGARGAFGGAGNDSIFVNSSSYAEGGPGDDRIRMQDFFGEAHGGSGNDTLSVSVDGGRKLFGEAGNDTIFVYVSDEAHGGAGNDTIIMDGFIPFEEAGNCTVDGGNGDDLITLSHGGNTISGGRGNDTIRAGYAEDLLGDDPATVGQLVHGNSGNDDIETDIGNDSVSGDSGDDVIRSGRGDDVISGGTHDDMLDGGAGNDIIEGDRGSDTITGGTGDDRLSGGSGIDHFILREGDGDDRIDDFRPDTDFIDLSAIDSLGSYADLQLTDTEDGVLIDLGGGDSLLLEQVTIAGIDVHQDHFLF